MTRGNQNQNSRVPTAEPRSASRTVDYLSLAGMVAAVCCMLRGMAAWVHVRREVLLRGWWCAAEVAVCCMLRGVEGGSGVLLAWAAWVHVWGCIAGLVCGRGGGGVLRGVCCLTGVP